MLVARMKIGEALERRFEREMLGCSHCQVVTRQKKESEDNFEKRAWELGDYFLFTRFGKDVKIIVLCDDHFSLSPELDEVVAGIPLAMKELEAAS